MNFTKKSFISPEEQYFSIDDILATNERVPCCFNEDAYKLGFLDPSSTEEDLKQGTKLDLPLWMAKGLHDLQGRTTRQRVISVGLPKVYREAYREILNADAEVVNLNKMGPYFFHFGICLLKFPHDDAETTALYKMLTETFRNRFRHLMDSSQNSMDEDVTTLISQFDRTEQVLFNIGQKSMYDIKSWQEQKIKKIETANLVLNHKKRKRTILEEGS